MVTSSVLISSGISDFIMNKWIILTILTLSISSCQGCGSSRFFPTDIYLSFSGDTAYLSTPNYPNDYSSNEECYWLVRAPFGRTVGYSFSNDFDLEQHFSCIYDYVRLYDGNTESNTIYTKCGSITPSSGVTSSRYLLVKFKTDSSTNKKGFRMKFTTDSIPSRPTSLSPSTSISVTGNLGAIIGGTIGGIVGLVLLCCCCICCCSSQSSSKGTVQPHPQQHQQQQQQQQSGDGGAIFIIAAVPDNGPQPPAYQPNTYPPPYPPPQDAAYPPPPNQYPPPPAYTY